MEIPCVKTNKHHLCYKNLLRHNYHRDTWTADDHIDNRPLSCSYHELNDSMAVTPKLHERGSKLSGIQEEW